MLFAPCVCFHILVKFMWPPIGKIAAHSAYDMFSWYKYLIVNLVFPTSAFWSGNLFLSNAYKVVYLLKSLQNKHIFFFTFILRNRSALAVNC